MLIKSVSFVKSSEKWQNCPEPTLPEYAFIGRSNVGKSSLINMIMGRKYLAKTSQTPGKTQLINHFLVNENWFLTDLPGYGYAKVSKTQRKDFEKLITQYILNRKNLICTFVLVDIRHEVQKIDLEFMQWCGENGIAFSIVFTKADKLKKNIIEKNVKNYQEKLLEYWEELPPMFVTSAENSTGKEEILNYITEINHEVKNISFL